MLLRISKRLCYNFATFSLGDACSIVPFFFRFSAALFLTLVDPAISNGCRSDHLPIPSNISVVLTSWRPPAVRVTWHFPAFAAEPSANITTVLTGFQLTYRPVNARYRVVYDVPPEQRSLTLKPLLPRTEYQVYLVAEDPTGLSNISNKVHFISPDVRNDSSSVSSDPPLLEEEATVATFTVHEEEVVIVVLVLAVWVFVIALFFNKWGKIRMLEPYQPQYHSHPVIPKPSRIPVAESLVGPIDRHLQHFNTIECGASLPGYSMSQSRMRPRQNSVFVGSPYRSRSGSVLSEPRMPRKVKSAEDIKSLIVQIGDRSMQSTAL